MDANTLTVAQRVPAAARGDREAFAAIVDGTRAVVCSIALAIVRDAELSRDIAQDVFLAAWRDLAQLRDPDSLLPWLRQLTRNRAYHVMRTERRRLRWIDQREVETLTDAVDPRPNASDGLIADDDRRMLAAVLDGLPNESREIVTLYYREGQSTAHVATLLGLSEANVRQRLSRARMTLRRELLDRYGATALKTAPDSRFTAAVLASIKSGGAESSAAATLAETSSAPALLNLLVAAGGTLAGAVAGIAGVVIGCARLKRQARSAVELDRIGRFQRAAAGLVVVTALILPLAWLLTHSPWSPLLAFAAFNAGLAALYGIWLPRILRDRHALEMAEDPDRASRLRASERRAAVVGWALGAIVGGAAVIAGILFAR